MKTRMLAIGLAVVLSAAVTPAWAMFETDKELSAKASVRMSDAIKTAEEKTSGKAVEVNMGKDDGRVVYKIEVVDGSNKKRHVYVDAQTGQIHVIK